MRKRMSLPDSPPGGPVVYARAMNTAAALPVARFETLAGWLRHCEHLHGQEIDLTLDRVLEVKRRVGLSFNMPVISVAGTNGKGSTCAMLESMARAAGLKVGLYSKPHLLHFEERCRIEGATVAPEALLPHFEAIERARGDVSLSFFEYTTLAIMRLLSCSDLDLVILEVGLGGRLDAVNAIDADCAVITGIDIDHTEFLGSTREAIGFEKAGIMRCGRPVIIGDADPPASVLRHAHDIGALPRCRGRDFDLVRQPDTWTWRGWAGERSGLPRPALQGDCQFDNAATAIAALQALGLRLDGASAAVQTGLRTVRLAGRFEVFAGDPMLVLDVAHNVQSVRSLAANLAAQPHPGRTAAVFGCMHDKDVAALLPLIEPQVDIWHLTDLPLPRAEKADVLARLLAKGAGRPLAGRVFLHARPADALEAALGAGTSPVGRIVAFGSFYTVGGVMAAQVFRTRWPAPGGATSRPA